MTSGYDPEAGGPPPPVPFGASEPPEDLPVVKDDAEAGVENIDRTEGPVPATENKGA